MKKSRVSQQLVRAPRRTDVMPMAKVARKHGLSEQTIGLWRRRYGELHAAGVRRLKQLEQENERLKTLVAERDFEIEVLKEISRKKC